MTRILFALILVGCVCLAQDPLHGMAIDSKGLLQWAELKPSICDACKAAKALPSPECSDAADGSCWAFDGASKIRSLCAGVGPATAACMRLKDSEIEIDCDRRKHFLARVDKSEGEARTAKVRILSSCRASQTSQDPKVRELIAARKWSKALELLNATVKAGRATAYTWLDIANCREQLGEYTSALEAFDLAIGDGGWWQPYTDKAACMERKEGPEVVVKWFTEEEK